MKFWLWIWIIKKRDCTKYGSFKKSRFQKFILGSKKLIKIIRSQNLDCSDNFYMKKSVTYKTKFLKVDKSIL